MEPLDYFFIGILILIIGILIYSQIDEIRYKKFQKNMKVGDKCSYGIAGTPKQGVIKEIKDDTIVVRHLLGYDEIYKENVFPKK